MMHATEFLATEVLTLNACSGKASQSKKDSLSQGQKEEQSALLPCRYTWLWQNNGILTLERMWIDLLIL